ncbi:MAG TPA: alpha/beta hydrolase [Kofleriaceae bacterium]|jgi:pimeloyl-ACP methyl ester carboxylesterase
MKQLIFALSLAACAAPKLLDPQDPKPTIVLVHGAFADASSWNGVIARLQQRGYTVIAPPNPLRGVDADAATVSRVLATVKGPVVLVGHSYGGMVISEAAQGNAAVKALVYIAAFAPETGESAGQILQKFPVPTFGPDRLQPVPNGDDADIYIKRDAFRDVFAADVPEATAAEMAATQRPLAGSAIGAPFAGTPAWKSIPSWALVSRADHAIAPAAERFMAERAHSHVVEVDASHAVAVSHPDAVVALIVDAAHSVH